MTRKTKKTRKLRKVLLTVCCAALLVCVTIGATVAYLTSTATVENTFTVGNVKITLDEADTDNDNNTADNVTIDGKVRDTANNYHIFPDGQYDKDPIVHVDQNSENCYLFVKVENGLAAIEAAATIGEGDTAQQMTIADQMAANGWVPLADVANVYYYTDGKGTTLTANAGKNIDVFSAFKISDAVIGGERPDDAAESDTNKYLGDYADATITVTAYAIQADGFDTAAEAWDAAKLA